MHYPHLFLKLLYKPVKSIILIFSVQFSLLVPSTCFSSGQAESVFRVNRVIVYVWAFSVSGGAGSVTTKA